MGLGTMTQEYSEWQRELRELGQKAVDELRKSPKVCPDCQGTGIQAGRREKECDRCEGSGYAIHK